MLEEMGEPYQLIEKSTRPDELQTAEYVRLNPNARIPTLVDGDFVLWESVAINLYLAQKYLGPMHCVDVKVLGLAANGASGQCWRWKRCYSSYFSIARYCPNSLVIPRTQSVTSCYCENRWDYSTMS
jgi:glutathione S-transferase